MVILYTSSLKIESSDAGKVSRTVVYMLNNGALPEWILQAKSFFNIVSDKFSRVT